ncbi:hypothetical protein EBR57_08695, partial [bacterium]|nr:hypothetical protein [bacterium]
KFSARTLNKKLGIMKDSSNIDVVEALYDPQTDMLLTDSIKICTCDYIDGINTNSVISVGRLQYLYTDFKYTVGAYFGDPNGFASLFSEVNEFDINGGGVFDASAYIQVVNSSQFNMSGSFISDLSGFVTISDINKTLEYALDGNVFRNRFPNSKKLNYGVVDGFIAGDLIFIPEGFTITLSLDIQAETILDAYSGGISWYKKNTELMLGDGSIVQSSKSAITDLSAMMAQLREVVQLISKQVVTTGNISKLNGTLDNVYHLSAGLCSVEGTSPGMGPVGIVQTLAKTKIRAEAEIVPVTNTSDFASYDAYFDSTIGANFIRTGISGSRGSKQPVLNVQYGTHLWTQTAARVGYIENNLGAGIDYRPIPKAKVSVEVYNIDYPQVTLKVKYAISDNLGMVVNVKKNPMTFDYDNVGFGFSLSN